MNASEGQQERILRTFTVLHTLRQDWGGALIAASGLGPDGAALAAASNVAGAVCLCVEDDSARIKEAIRSGACDFIVNTLDEALRTIKNEIRKHLPLSVGLQADPVSIFNEMFERGIAPDAFAIWSDHGVALESLRNFRSNGVSILDFELLHFELNDARMASIHVGTQVETLLRQKRWRLQSFIFETSSALRTFEADALSLLSEQDKLRRSWLRAAPRILQRERPWRRVLWLTEDEEQTLKKMMP